MPTDLSEIITQEHRRISLFALIQCWIRHLEGVVISRNKLENLLNISRFRSERTSALVVDVRGYFPHSEEILDENHQFAGVLFSRIHICDGCCFEEDGEIQKATDDGLIGEFWLWDSRSLKFVGGSVEQSLFKQAASSSNQSADSENLENQKPLVEFAFDIMFGVNKNNNETLLRIVLDMLAKGNLSPEEIVNKLK